MDDLDQSPQGAYWNADVLPEGKLHNRQRREIVALFVWDNTYSVKVQRCDNDHKRLFAIINELQDAMMAGKGSEIIQRIVRELTDYTKYHFSGEEALLEKTGYPALEPHRLQHREFVSKVEEFERGLKAGAVGQSVAVTNFLKDWLVKHIQHTDRQYSTHLNANGIV